LEFGVNIITNFKSSVPFSLCLADKFATSESMP